MPAKRSRPTSWLGTKVRRGQVPPDKALQFTGLPLADPGRGSLPLGFLVALAGQQLGAISVGRAKGGDRGHR